jgi:hypothetical protein
LVEVVVVVVVVAAVVILCDQKGPVVVEVVVVVQQLLLVFGYNFKIQMIGTRKTGSIHHSGRFFVVVVV